MSKRTYIVLAIILCIAVNLPLQRWFFRWDLTEDHRYSVSVPTRNLMRELQEPLEITLLMGGDLNASFLRLKHAVEDLTTELDVYGEVQFTEIEPTEAVLKKMHLQSLRPTIIHERNRGGQTVQTTIYPYALLRYGKKQRVVPLLMNTRGLSGEENINHSIEQLEFAFTEGISCLRREEAISVAFLEGHGELDEMHVLDLENQLSSYFTVHRGVLGYDASALDPYRVVIIADPELPFSEKDKFIIDQYIMRGGRVLWVLNGVRFSADNLSDAGFTPVIAADINLQDMLFRYGVRVEPVLLQDQQCLPVPVDVSTDPAHPNFQPLPWTYAPLLLTSEASPITKGLGQVSATFASALSLVGEDELHKELLLATSNHTAITGVPAEVDLSDLTPNPELFKWQYIPVSALIEGSFSSLFAHRMMPDSITGAGEKRTTSVPTKQIVVASGSVIRGEVQDGQPMPLGYDRYSQMQFANRDFLLNAVLYLSDDEGLMALRQRSVRLRLLNESQAREKKALIQTITIALPLLILGLVALLFLLIRKQSMTKPFTV